MYEYNKLTKSLIEQGYTADNYPKDIVRIATGGLMSSDPLDNIYGGFEYVRGYIEKQTFITSCGLLCKGSSAMTNTFIGGKDYCYEQDGALAVCPYDNYGNKACEHENLEICGFTRCPVQRTKEEYVYEGSLEDLLKRREDQKKADAKAYIKAHNGRICQNHMKWVDGKWTHKYDPSVCAQGHCRAVCIADECPVFGRQLTKEKGNVYYDIERSGRDKSKDGTIFEGERFHTITKGKQVFKKPISMDICNAYVKYCSEELKRHVLTSEYNKELLFAKINGDDLSINIVNIRAMKKDARDIDADIADVAAGIEVIHESDIRQNEKRKKKEHRAELKVKKIRAYENKIKKVGWDSLDDFEKNRILKVLDMDRVDEMDSIFLKREYDKSHKPIQLTIEDYIGGIT